MASTSPGRSLECSGAAAKLVRLQALAHSPAEVHNDGPGGMVFLTGDCRVQSNALSCLGHCDPRASGIGLCSDATQKPVGWALRNVCVFSFQA